MSAGSEFNLSIGFYRSLQRFPDRPALSIGEVSFSYRELAAMAAVIKEAIGQYQKPTQRLVNILAYRSSHAYAGILGILASGCGYVPMHPEYPAQRNYKIATSAQTEIIIVSKECEAAFKDVLTLMTKPMTFLCLDIAAQEYATQYPMHVFVSLDLKQSKQSLQIAPVEQKDIAYLLFTSGSTGEPKGVPVSHGNVRAYVEFITERYNIKESDRCSQMHDMTFDFSIHDIFPTWEKGACLCAASKEDKLLPVAYIHKQNITCWASVPSIGVIIDKYGRLTAGAFPKIRYSFFCGEALYATLAEKWQAATPHGTIVNLYGPTETTMAISCYDWKPKADQNKNIKGIVPIGYIFKNQRSRIMRDEKNIAGVNEPGELVLSGTQVTRGYWNNPQQTQAHYVTFEDTTDTIWYKTGDLVQQDSDGCLYYLGRVDHQVKILGNRVELGEIDQVLRDATGVDLAVSLPWPIQEGNANGVVAFVCSENLNEQRVLDYCKMKLPKYMVPTKIHAIEQMPFNQNGKIDRLQLKQLLERK